MSSLRHADLVHVRLPRRPPLRLPFECPHRPRLSIRSAPIPRHNRRVRQTLPSSASRVPQPRHPPHDRQSRIEPYRAAFGCCRWECPRSELVAQGIGPFGEVAEASREQRCEVGGACSGETDCGGRCQGDGG